MELHIAMNHLRLVFRGEAEEFAALVRVLDRGPASDRSPSPPPVAKPAAKPAAAKPPAAKGSRRTYGGQATRRDKVLEAMAKLRREGAATQTLAQIIQAFAALFPGESTRNLDQVIRDLAQKTDRVRSPRRGTYELAES